jgi:hypothetical protein
MDLTLDLDGKFPLQHLEIFLLIRVEMLRWLLRVER